MASRYRTYNRKSYDRENGQRKFYVYGSTVRQSEAASVRTSGRRSSRPSRTSRQVVKNRNRAMSINPAYVVFLAVAAVCAVLVCIFYLNLQAKVVKQSENVTSLQEELANLTEANDTRYNAAVDSVNIEAVKDRAMNEMGMVYESEGTVIEYDRPAGDYVKQYSDIPEDGVLAKSSDVSR